jgi:hypothetical protein
MMKKLISTVSLAALICCFSTHASQAMDVDDDGEGQTPATLAVRPARVLSAAARLLSADLWNITLCQVVNLTIIKERGTYSDVSQPGIDEKQRNTLKRVCKFFYSIVNRAPTEYCAIFKKHPVGFLNQFSNLRTLDLSFNKFVTNEEIMTLPNLKRLVLEHNRTITDQGIQALTQLTNLNLRHNSIVSNRGISTLTNLEKINIRSNQQITMDGISYLINLKKITANLFSDNSITKERLSHLTNLKKIDHPY